MILKQCFPTNLFCLILIYFFVYLERENLLTSHILHLNNYSPSTILFLLNLAFLRLNINLVCTICFT